MKKTLLAFGVMFVGASALALTQATQQPPATPASQGRGQPSRTSFSSATAAGNQSSQKAVAEKLNAQWNGSPVVAHIGEYYTAPPGTPNVLRDLGVVKQWQPDDGLHDSPGITLNMMLTDPNSVRWEQRVKAGKATINGVSIADKAKALELARKVVDARATRTVEVIKKAIANRGRTAPSQ